MDQTVMISALRLTCLSGALFTTVTLSWISLFWIVALIGSICLIHPSKKFKILEEADLNRQNPLRGKPKISEDNLSVEVKQKITKYIENFVLYNAEETTSLQNFSPIRDNSQCVFARRSKLWGSPEWNVNLSLEENVHRVIPMFIKFCLVCQELGIDGFVYELPAKYSNDIQTFGEAVRRVMKVVSDNDPKKFHCMDKSYIDKTGWVFQFNNVTFFVTTFAPFYSESHSRYSFETENSYILFQPEISFAQHDIPNDTPYTGWTNPRTIRDKIRIAFKDAGRSYKIRNTVSYPMVHDIVKPMDDGIDDVLQWWIK